MSGTSSSLARMRTVSMTYGVSASGSSGRNRWRSAARAKGRSTTGPTPCAMSTPNPTAATGTTMSENRMAASTPWRRTGCRVISAASSGWRTASRMLPVPRMARYSGSDRPAWRMNHTGVWGTGWRRQAWRNGWSATTDTRPDSTGRDPETVRRAPSVGRAAIAAIFECFPLMASHPDLEAEQAHIDHAYRRLDSMRATAEAMLRDAFAQGSGTMQSLTERDVIVRTSLGRLEQLQIGRESLVFGRIDRAEADGVGPEAFHIGRLAVNDEQQDPLVVDWRAPVAEPFYRATGVAAAGVGGRPPLLLPPPLPPPPQCGPRARRHRRRGLRPRRRRCRRPVGGGGSCVARRARPGPHR